ncbi:MAG TPA: hypothetical protein VF290_12875 [Pyrinomonadaceae bacterium]
MNADKTQMKTVFQYVAAAALCMLILCIFFKIWRADLRAPFYYSGDSIFYAMSTKGTIENGWYWRNPAVAAPGGLEMYEFPTYDNAVVIFMKLIAIFTSNPFLVMNLFYLLSFPLITVTSVYVLRQFNLSYIPALFVSLLYAFLPFHFMRNQNHLILSAYYIVPPAIMVVLWLTSEVLAPRTRKFIISVLICILLGTSGVYYPFFFCFLLVVAGAVGAMKFKSLRPLVMAVVFVAIVCTTIVINLSPSFIHAYKHGSLGAMRRAPIEAEIFGLKISQLLLPITLHRIDLFNRIKRFHNANSTVTENDATSLGIIGSIGFLGLLAQLLYRKDLMPDMTGVFHDLSVLNICSVLLGVIGGFGLLFSLYVSPGIRCYNRISVYIAFFSLMAVAIGLENIYRRTKFRSIFYVLLAVALILGFLDQTTRGYRPDYALTNAEFYSDKEFINRIEASVPAAAMIFQLPYIPFPEYPRVQKMIDYDHFRGYVHSQNLRWSYGAIKNRDGDLMQQQVAALPVGQMAERLVFSGFSGIYVDRYGYEDGGAGIESELESALQTKPLISPNGRLVFFNLADFEKSLRQRYPDSEWEAKKELSLHPLLADWKGGFSGFEHRPGKTWRWSSSEGEVVIRNMSQRPRTVKLEMVFATGYPEMDDFVISGLISEQLKVNNNPVPYSKTVTIPPGESVIRFRSAAKRVNAPTDTRFLVFRVEDFKMTEVE